MVVAGPLAVPPLVGHAADVGEVPLTKQQPKIEVSAGVDIGSHVWLAYSGATYSPFGSLYANGFRLRAAGGYGQYSYTGQRRGQYRSFDAMVSYAEALLGYQWQAGALTTKAFAGIASIDHVITPDDPIAYGGLLTQGLEIGVKGALELWLNLGDDAWSSLDLSWTSAHQTYAGRWRLGYRVLPTLSLGPEFIVNGNALDAPSALPDGSFREELKPAGRIGAFARYEWASGEISLSGGIGSETLAFDGDVSLQSAYGTANWLTRF